MKLLLDTHIIIWSAGNPEKLSQRVRNLLIDPNNFWLFKGCGSKNTDSIGGDRDRTHLQQ